MIWLLATGAAGLSSWWLWPRPWRAGLALGWCAGVVVEAILLRARLRLLRGAGSRRGLLQIAASSFLAKLALLAGGGVAGAAWGLYHVPSYLLAFLAAVLAGEALALAAALRWGRAARRAGPSPTESSRLP